VPTASGEGFRLDPPKVYKFGVCVSGCPSDD
jgi:hypothetical protein